MNLLRFLILAAGSLTLRQQQWLANVRQEDRHNSSVRPEQLHPVENANREASPQVSAARAIFRSPANAAKAPAQRAVSVRPALSPREATVRLEASPEAIVWTAALLLGNARREPPDFKIRQR
jgi:hypothetical protein